jgi:uncharacterized phage protein (TIGR01671 family)
MRTIKFRFVKNNKVVGFQELKSGSIMDMSYDWDFANQFTGLLDSCGKEIYEGDVCNVRRYNSKTWEIVTVKWSDVYAMFSFRGYYQKQPSDFYGLRIEEAEEREVIGNIYENPELLKGEKHDG